jgi:hypothetical protein
MAKKYFFRDDPDHGFTSSQVKRMGRAKQLEIMEVWFRANYEDPGNELPYESREGGYQWIWGGPYDADEELQDEFSGIVNLDRIQELSQELAYENWQWSPTVNHPSRRDDERDREPLEPAPEPVLDDVVARIEAGADQHYGDGYEQGLRDEIIERLAALEMAVHELQERPVGIGHNNPPDDEPSLDGERQEAVLAAVAEVRAELANPKPDAVRVGRAAKLLRDIGGWLGRKADKAVDKGIEWAVPLLLAGLAGLIPQIKLLLTSVTTLLAHWLDAISFFF